MDEPIYNAEAERALIAFALRNPETYLPLADIVKPKDFGWETYSWCWEAMGILTEKGLLIDAISLGDELERAGRLKEFTFPGSPWNGRMAISTLKDLETSCSGETYAITVQDYSGKRAIDRHLRQAIQWVRNGRTAASILADLESSFGNIVLHSGKINKHTINMPEAASAARHASEAAQGGANDILTGLPDLDRILGMQKTELITIAARPGEGKSSLCGTIAIHAARNGKRVKLFTLEMGAVQVAQRLCAQICGVESYRIMRGKLSQDEWVRYFAAADELAALPITICDLPAISIGQIRNETRREPIDLGILDYVQLARADTKQDRRDLDIGEVTGGLKALAIELNIPWIEAAQLSRATEARADRRPTLADLRESGSIENDSDSVVFIYHPDRIKRSTTQLLVEKHRNGPVGAVDCYFEEEIMRFVGLDKQPSENIRQYDV